MTRRREKRNTLLFVAGLLLGGLLHALDQLVNELLYTVPDPAASALPAFASTLLFVLNLSVYSLLLFWWAQSVHDRLLPSAGRRCMRLAAMLMLLFLLIRAVKYRLADYGSLLEHVCWYAYYLPLVGIPALFLVTCLRMGPEGPARRREALLVLLTAGLLILGVATNDLHFLMFRPRPEMLPQGGQWSTYYTGPLWYGVYGYVIVCILLGLTLLALTDRRKHSRRRTLLPSLLLLAMLGMLNLTDRLLGTRGLPTPWAFPETAVFCMVVIFESCIRSRLIPFNEGFIDFFARMQLPAEVTDPALRPVFRTAERVEANQAQRFAALQAPMLLDPDTRLYGKRIDAGCAFWLGDERTLNRLNEALADANEVLESENELLRLETEQAAERLRVDARNRVYGMAAVEVYGAQKKIAALLDRMEAEPGNDALLARVLLLFAYVKRKTNFVLQSAERQIVTAQELCLALEETARFLELCGVRASVVQNAAHPFPSAQAMALYDSFACLAEHFVGQAGSLMAMLADDTLRLMVECPLPQTLPQTPAPLQADEEDGQLYLTLGLQKVGAA